jgi:hypothetical protein
MKGLDCKSKNISRAPDNLRPLGPPQAAAFAEGVPSTWMQRCYPTALQLTCEPQLCPHAVIRWTAQSDDSRSADRWFTSQYDGGLPHRGGLPQFMPPVVCCLSASVPPRARSPHTPGKESGRPGSQCTGGAASTMGTCVSTADFNPGDSLFSTISHGSNKWVTIRLQFGNSFGNSPADRNRAQHASNA